MTKLTASYISSIHPFEFENQFGLTIQHSDESTKIIMRLYTPFVNTKYIPQTYSVLKNQLPSILRSTCFNEYELPFHEEVKHTEIGHLFEHILLEYLCMLKLSSGHNEACFDGVTNWNWKKDPVGTFYIKVTAGFEERDIFPQALQKAIDLTKIILTK